MYSWIHAEPGCDVRRGTAGGGRVCHYVGYYLKKKQKRWWYVPAAMATAFDLFFVVNGAEK